MVSSFVLAEEEGKFVIILILVKEELRNFSSPQVEGNHPVNPESDTILTTLQV